MDKPTWVKVIGILGIIFGCTGIFGALQMMIMPQMFGFQQDLFETAMDQARHDPDFPDGLGDVISQLWDRPEWFGTWAIIFGFFGLLVGAFYLTASIRLLQAKPNADKVMLWALGVSIFLALLQAVTILTAGTFMAAMFAFGAAISLVIDLILLIVIVTSDRSIFAAGPVTANTSQNNP